MRPSRRGEKGQRIEFPAPFDLSNMILVCPKCEKTTRVAYNIEENIVSENSKNKKKIKKYRICRKCGKIIN